MAAEHEKRVGATLQQLCRIAPPEFVHCRLKPLWRVCAVSSNVPPQKMQQLSSGIGCNDLLRS